MTAVLARPAASGASSSTFAVVLGWANSNLAHVSKAADLWTHELGVPSLTTNITAQETFFCRDRTGLRRRAAALAQEAHDAGARSIIPHCFSNGGVVLYLTMLEEMRAGRAPHLPVVGKVFDSSPSQWVHPVVILPVLAAAPPKTWAETLLVLGETLPYVLSRVGSNEMDWFNTGTRDPHTNPSDSPELFLHSSGDRLVRPGEVERFAALRQGQGVQVARHDFGPASPHVQHMRTSPELYLHALRSWTRKHRLGDAADGRPDSDTAAADEVAYAA